MTRESQSLGQSHWSAEWNTLKLINEITYYAYIRNVLKRVYFIMARVGREGSAQLSLIYCLRSSDRDHRNGDLVLHTPHYMVNCQTREQSGHQIHLGAMQHYV